MRKYQHLENNIVQAYNNGMSQYQIAKTFDVPAGTIRRILILNNIKIREGNQNKKHTCQDDYFSVIDTPEKAYVIGFLTADGNISKRDNQISIGLAARDREHLVKIKDALSLTNNIIDYGHNLYGKMCATSLLVWTSAQMKSDLAIHNVIPNKSNIAKFSKHIPKQFINSYILGIIDGDGSYYVDKYNQIHINITGTLELLSEIQQVLVANCEVSINKIVKEKRCNNTYYLTYGGAASVIRIVNYLYDNNKLYLDRKFEIVQSFITYLKDKEAAKITRNKEILDKYNTGKYTKKKLAEIYSLECKSIGRIIKDLILKETIQHHA